MSSRFHPIPETVEAALTTNAPDAMAKIRGWFIEGLVLLILVSYVDDRIMENLLQSLAVIIFTVGALCVLFTHSFTRRALSVLRVNAKPALDAAKDRQVQRARDARSAREHPEVPKS